MPAALLLNLDCPLNSNHTPAILTSYFLFLFSSSFLLNFLVLPSFSSHLLLILLLFLSGYVAKMGKIGKAYRILVGKPLGRRPLEKPGRRIR
jgi:hypothetical protein